MSSTSASATWTIVSVLRVMLRSRLALALRPPEPQRVGQADAAPLQHRNRAEGETGGDREDERETRATWHRRQSDRGAAAAPAQRLRTSLQRGGGQAQAGGAAEEAEQQALDQHLARQAAAAGADGGADGELLGPPLGPDQQQVGDVGAGDQQDDPDRRHHHPQALADVADEIVDERAAPWGRAARPPSS